MIAQFVSMVIALVPLFKSKIFTGDLSYWRLDISLLKQMVSLWLPMFVNSAVITIGGSFVSRNVNAIGPVFYSGNFFWNQNIYHAGISDHGYSDWTVCVYWTKSWRRIKRSGKERTAPGSTFWV